MLLYNTIQYNTIHIAFYHFSSFMAKHFVEHVPIAAQNAPDDVYESIVVGRRENIYHTVDNKLVSA